MKCPNCGAPVREVDARCGSCQQPLVGEGANAPRGSESPRPERSPRPWNAAVWGAVITVIITAAVIAVLST